ncbi:MAG: sensor histidine kinase [Dehalococcoidia bacterium]
MALVQGLRDVVQGRRWPVANQTSRVASSWRLSLAGQFLVVSLVILLVGMVIIGAWVGQEIESRVLNRTAAVTGLYVNSVVAPYLQPLINQAWLNEQEVTRLDSLLTTTPLGQQIVAFKVWSPDGEVLYSPNHALIQQRFGIDADLAKAVKGEVSADVTDLQAAENEYERQHWRRLLQVYLPIRRQGQGNTIAVAEFYQQPNELEHEVRAAQLRAWSIVAGVMLAMYLSLAGIVKRGSDTIGRQQAALREKVSELSQILGQNAVLHDRVRQAASRTTALNEQALRRISADLHDGPGQVLALALLRLDPLAEHLPGENADLSVVHGAVRDALNDVRAISRGLRLPELEPLTPTEVVERAVHDHERRNGIRVTMAIEAVPEPVPLAIKIALFRSLQEALSNATRHGGGVDVLVHVQVKGGMIALAVSDHGPGFIPEQVATDGHLGLVGLQERAELLGGSFGIESELGHGTTLRVCWPVWEPDMGA